MHTDIVLCVISCTLLSSETDRTLTMIKLSGLHIFSYFLVPSRLFKWIVIDCLFSASEGVTFLFPVLPTDQLTPTWPDVFAFGFLSSLGVNQRQGCYLGPCLPLVMHLINIQLYHPPSLFMLESLPPAVLSHTAWCRSSHQNKLQA